MPVHLRRLGPIAAALALTAAPALAQERREIPDFRTFGEAASAEDAAAIDALIDRYRTAWGSEDADALAALHAEDIEWINAYARVFRGREPLRDFMANRMFPGFDQQVSQDEAAAMRPVSIRYLGENAAVAHIVADSARGAARDGAEGARRVHLHLILEKQDDGAWRAAHIAIMDAR